MSYRRQKLGFDESESGTWIPGLGDNKPRPRKFLSLIDFKWDKWNLSIKSVITDKHIINYLYDMSNYALYPRKSI